MLMTKWWNLQVNAGLGDGTIALAHVALSQQD